LAQGGWTPLIEETKKSLCGRVHPVKESSPRLCGRRPHPSTPNYTYAKNRNLETKDKIILKLQSYTL